VTYRNSAPGNVKSGHLTEIIIDHIWYLPPKTLWQQGYLFLIRKVNCQNDALSHEEYPHHRSNTNSYFKTFNEGFHLSFGGSPTDANSAGSTICLTKKVN
jgi:hypothetical protein